MQNQTKTQKNYQAEDFKTYAKKIIKSVEEGLSRHELDPIESLAIMVQLSETDSVEELHRRVDELKQKYPSLNEIEYKEKVETEEALDDVVQSFVSYMIKAGKVKEAQAFAEVANKPDATLENLKATYPEFANYLNSK